MEIDGQVWVPKKYRRRVLFERARVARLAATALVARAIPVVKA